MPNLESPSARAALACGPAWLAGVGGLLAAAAIGLAAYAAHGPADAHAQSNLQTAALYAFGHGIALAALSRPTGRWLGRTGLIVLLLGTLAFCGSLAGNALLQWPGRLAPAGGMAMIAGWLLWALDTVRR